MKVNHSIHNVKTIQLMKSCIRQSHVNIGSSIINICGQNSIAMILSAAIEIPPRGLI